MARKEEQKPIKRGVFIDKYEFFNQIKLTQAKKDLIELTGGVGKPENIEHILVAYLRIGGMVTENTKDQPIEKGKKILYSSWKKRAEKLGISFKKLDKFIKRELQV